MSGWRTLRRKAANSFMLSLTALCALVVAGVLLFILGYLAVKGASALRPAFFTQLPRPVGEPGGGMANAIVGTAKLLLLASIIGLPIGFLAGVYLAEFASGTPAFLVRYATDLLNGVPSIVMGIFAYGLIVLPMRHFSTLAGGFALGVMMIPIAVRSTETFLRAVPQRLRDAALALGATRARTVFSVVVPAAGRGILTGVLLDLARVAGETAPLLFTAFNNRFWSPGWNQPTASLPVMIFTYAISPYEDWHKQAWAAGLVLLVLVLGANVASHAILGGRRKG